MIYFVTPTYTRPVQIAELTRLGQTLKGVSALHWILVEDSDRCSPVIGKLLQRLGTLMESNFARSFIIPGMSFYFTP